jgi:hypothetical protein
MVLILVGCGAANVGQKLVNSNILQVFMVTGQG